METAGKSVDQSLDLLNRRRGRTVLLKAGAMITFDTDPSRYRHWKLSFEGYVATLALDVQEDAGIQPGYKLKLNSYDLGVDIELNDALNRIRFEHPEVKVVVLTSARERMFCAGANIYMLGSSSHAWKVNFCKFTNETRNGIEDSSRHSGLKFIAALNGTTAGGGYELALACDEIGLIDDRSSTVSLPEVPLLGVLPGTGGLTRLIDKRRVRRDLADAFCTTSEGVRADRAKAWHLVDWTAPPQRFAEVLRERIQTRAQQSGRPEEAAPVPLPPLERTVDDKGYHYSYVDVVFDRPSACRHAHGRRPRGECAAGFGWNPRRRCALVAARDGARARRRHPDAAGKRARARHDPAEDPRRRRQCSPADELMVEAGGHWFVRETKAFLRRTLARLDVTSRSLFAIIDRGSCFAGTLMELALAADRSYMLALPEGDNDAPRVTFSTANIGFYEMANGLTRLGARFCRDDAACTDVIKRAWNKPWTRRKRWRSAW